MVGQPGDNYWQVQFHRKGMDDFVVDADMVNAEEFVRQLRSTDRTSEPTQSGARVVSRQGRGARRGG